MSSAKREFKKVYGDRHLVNNSKEHRPHAFQRREIYLVSQRPSHLENQQPADAIVITDSENCRNFLRRAGIFATLHSEILTGN